MLKKKPMREVRCGTQFSSNLSDNRDRAFFELQGVGGQGFLQTALDIIDGLSMGNWQGSPELPL